MTNLEALELLRDVDHRLLRELVTDGTDKLALKQSRLHVKRAWDSVWATEHPLPSDPARELASEAELQLELRKLGTVKWTTGETKVRY